MQLSEEKSSHLVLSSKNLNKGCLVTIAPSAACSRDTLYLWPDQSTASYLLAVSLIFLICMYILLISFLPTYMNFKNRPQRNSRVSLSGFSLPLMASEDIGRSGRSGSSELKLEGILKAPSSLPSPSSDVSSSDEEDAVENLQA